MTTTDDIRRPDGDWIRSSKITTGAFHVSKETGDNFIVVLSLNEACRITSVCEGVRDEVSPKVGAISILPPGCRYSQTIAGVASALMYEVPWHLMEDWLAKESSVSPGHVALKSRVCVRDDVLARNLFGMAAAETVEGARETALHVTLERILRSHSNTLDPDRDRRVSGGLTPWQLKRVTEAVEDRIGTGINLDDLSSVAGLSKFHFIRAFSDSVGTTPHQYVLNRRLERALESLLDERADADGIARKFGFSHASHLARMLRRRFGVTPSDFKRLVFPQTRTGIARAT
ncbi:AraC family transcriptional regulator [Lichenibacterium ramalinae]|uniref:AraC family transcriptional regulator n=1 Tax=Lichenibacterium ramalinae TaxID=2316527 RepID=UPI00100F1830|nr:AraC family transcriptional regulator [Lichenibacterium ramalinae]